MVKSFSGIKMKIDMHVHSKYSKDAVSEPKQIVKYCKVRGIDGIALTDNSMKSFEIVKNEILCISSCEIATELGEILGFFINDTIRKRSFYDVVDEIHKMDGLVCVPHPFDIFRRLSMGKNITKIFHKVDLIEGFNSRCLINKFNEMAQKFGKFVDLPLTGGSDAHTLLEIGNAYTTINAESLSEIKKALLKGKIRFFGKLSIPYVHFYTLKKKYIKIFLKA